MEMSKEEQIYELGLLRAIGNSKYSIFFIMFFQVLILTFIGMLFGLLFGSVITSFFFGPLKSVLGKITSLETEFDVVLHITPFTFIISILAGSIIPLIFGIIPSISAARSNVLSSLKPHSRKINTKLRSIHLFIIELIVSLLFIGTGIALINMGFSGLLSFTSNPTMDTHISIIFLFSAQLFFILGSIMFATIFLPKLAYLVSHSLVLFLQKMKKICYRNLIKNLRRTKNSFVMMSLGLAFLLSLLITISSVKAGLLPGAHMRLGGDIRLGMYYNSDQTRIPLNTSKSISLIDNVGEICEVKNSHWGINNTICELYGTQEGEAIMIFVINTSSYVRMHSSNSIYSYEGKLPFSDFIHQLDKRGSILLQKGLSETIGKSVGQNVTVKTRSKYNFFPEIKANLTVLGLINILPGIEFTYNDPFDNVEEYAIVISWDTYFYLTNSSYKETTGYFWLNCDEINNADNTFEDIRILYNNSGWPWDSVNLDNNWQFRTILDEIIKINEVLNLILVIFFSIMIIGLTIAVLGMMTSMIMNVNNRRSEIGVYRSMGISKLQIIQLISGEILIIGLCASLIGIIIGIITGYLISLAPFMTYIPIFFTIPWNEIIFITVFIVSLNLLGSFIPAIKAVSQKIVNSIRKRGV
jgi:ABC-type antimicrobial peptide transport system permease subunit